MSTAPPISDITSMYYFYPFFFEGKRWRFAQQALEYKRTGDERFLSYTNLKDFLLLAKSTPSIPGWEEEDVLHSILKAKFSIPELAHYLRGIDTPLSSLLPDIKEEEKNFNVVYRNFYTLLKSQGLTHIGKTPIEKGPKKDVEGLEVRGENLLAIVDIALKNSYSEKRLKEVITLINKKTGGKSAKDQGISYFVLTSLPSRMLTKFVHISVFNNIRFFSPSELYILPSKHFLTPRVELVKDLRVPKNNLPEIRVDDKLIKELGYSRGDVIAVYDFSPHYRVVV